jgi:hypothetical protein
MTLWDENANMDQESSKARQRGMSNVEVTHCNKPSTFVDVPIAIGVPCLVFPLTSVSYFIVCLLILLMVSGVIPKYAAICAWGMRCSKAGYFFMKARYFSSAV